MSPGKRLWDPCVWHRGDDVYEFLDVFLADPQRTALLIAGAGFDPRATRVASELASRLGERLEALFLREERGQADGRLVDRAAANVARLTDLVPRSTVAKFDVFAADGATIGGRQVVLLLDGRKWDGYTDIIVDLSALSVGVGFPVVKYVYSVTRAEETNVHVMVADQPAMDHEIVSVPSEKAETVHSFKGDLGLVDRAEGAVLWLPQLAFGRRRVLDRIYTSLTQPQLPVDVCPVLPYPATRPRRGDELIEHYQEELESSWRIAPQSLLYADERNPTDLYRTILDIADARARVFRDLGGSLTVLSPLGSKAVSLGSLMAALERDLPVMYVEAQAYAADAVDRAEAAGGEELVHVWLSGEAYGVGEGIE